jgi:hypothetical protein
LFRTNFQPPPFSSGVESEILELDEVLAPRVEQLRARQCQRFGKAHFDPLVSFPSTANGMGLAAGREAP